MSSQCVERKVTSIGPSVGKLRVDMSYPLELGKGKPLWEGGLSPRAECPPGHSALGHNVPPDILH